MKRTSTRTRRKKILIVEDEKIVSMDLRFIVRSGNYSVAGETGSGKQAVLLARSLEPDLIIMDIGLRGSMDGVDAARTIKEQQDIPIVFITANSDERTLSRAKEVNAYGFIIKPYDEKDVLAAIEMALYKHAIEKELRENRLWLSTTLRSIGDAVIATDTKGIVKFLNSVAEKLTGWTEHDAIGKKLSEVFRIVNERTGRPIPNPVTRVLRSKEVIEISEFSVLVAKDGARTNVEDSAAPITTEQGAITGVVITFRDSTEKHRSQKALMDNEKRFRALVERSAEAFSILNAEGILQYSTNSASTIHGFAISELLGKNMFDFFHPEEYDSIRNMMTNILSVHGRSAMSTMRFRHKDGSWRWIEAVGTNLLSEPAVKGIVVNFRDVTYKMQADAALKHINDRLSLISRVTGEVVGTSSIQHQSIEMARQVEKAFNADAVIIRVIEGEEAHLLAVSGILEHMVSEVLPKQYGLTGLIVTSKRAVAIKNVKESFDIIYPSKFNINDKTKNLFLSCAGAPLLIGNTVIGTLGLFYRRINTEFTATDLDHVQIVANHLAVTIANNTLFKETKTQNDLLTQEIKERKRIEEHLRVSEERWRSLVHNAPNYILQIDAKGSIVFINTPILPYTIEELMTKSLYDIIDPKHSDSVKKLVLKAFSGGVSATIEVSGSAIDTVAPWYSLRISPIYEQGIVTSAIVIASDISHIKLNELKLSEAVQFNNEIITNAGEGIIVYDAEYRYKLWNRFMEKLTGIPQEALLGKVAFDMFPHLREEGVEKLLQRALKGEIVTSKDVSYYVPGTVKAGWIIGTYAPHRDATGKIIGVIATIRDITDRRISEEALRESELRFRSLFENAKDAVFIADPKTGLIIDANVEAERLLLRSRDEIIGMHQINLHPADRVSEATELFHEAMITLGGSPIEFEVIRSDGKRIPVEIKASVIRLDEDRVVLQGIFRDITDRIASEKKIRESEEKYRTLFEESQDGIYITNAEGRFIDVNSAMVRILGFATKKDLFDLNVAEDIYYHYEDRDKLISIFAKQDFVKDYELTLKKKDGSKVFVQITTVVERGKDGTPRFFRGTMRDITEKKRLEEQLIQAQKMESIGTLAGGIAHDFNNLLAMVLGTAELIQKQVHDDPKLESYIQKIIQASERGASISKQLLLFARPDQAELKPLLMNTFVKEISDFFAHFLPKSIVVEHEIPDSSMVIMGDNGQLHQALLNLAINAKDAMNETGTLRIELRRFGQEEMQSQYAQAGKHSYVGLIITDTGMGMTDETRKRIFEPFYSTKEKGKGTGLGLSIVHGIMNLHQGFIDVYSKVGRGTKFTLYFPIMDIDAASEQKEQFHSTAKFTESILIVDDEEMIREILRESLSDEGYNIFTAEDGYEALKIYEQRSSDIHLIITDLDMPIMNGYELYDQLRKINPHVNVIVSSGYLSTSLRNNLFELGIRDIIAKPYKFEDIFRTIRTILDGKTGT